MSRPRTVTRLGDRRLTKLSVREIINEGWIKQINQDLLELFQIDDDHIALRVNEQLTNIRFKIAGQTIPNRLWRNGYVPHDKQWLWYVVDERGRKRRFLYLLNKQFGTREQLGLRFVYNCMSRNQRAIYSAGCRIRLEGKRRRQARKKERRLAAYKVKMHMT